MDPFTAPTNPVKRLSRAESLYILALCPYNFLQFSLRTLLFNHINLCCTKLYVCLSPNIQANQYQLEQVTAQKIIMLHYQPTFSNLAYLQQPLPMQDATILPCASPSEPCPPWPSSPNSGGAARFHCRLQIPSTYPLATLDPTEPHQQATIVDCASALELVHPSYHDSFHFYGNFDTVERSRSYELNTDVTHPLSSVQPEHSIWSDSSSCSPTSPYDTPLLPLGNPLLPHNFLPDYTLGDTSGSSKRHQISRLSPESTLGLSSDSHSLTSPSPGSPADALPSPSFSDEEFVDVTSRKVS